MSVESMMWKLWTKSWGISTATIQLLKHKNISSKVEKSTDT